MINSKEEGEEYLKQVQAHLNDLRKISHEAGLNSHVALWLSISASFADSMDEVKMVVDIVMTHTEKRIEQGLWNRS